MTVQIFANVGELDIHIRPDTAADSVCLVQIMRETMAMFRVVDVQIVLVKLNEHGYDFRHLLGTIEHNLVGAVSCTRTARPAHGGKP